MRVAGVHIASGAVHLVFADCSAGVATFVSSTRIKPSDSLSEAERFADLVERIRAHLHSQQADEVALLETRQFNSLTYKNAYARVIAVAALIAASNSAHVSFKTHKTSEVGTKLDLPARGLQTIDPEVLGLRDKPTYWTTGIAEAAAVAASRS